MYRVRLGIMSVLLTLAVIATAFAPPASAQEAARQRSKAPADARLDFVDIADGARLPGKFLVRFALSGMEVVPAGQRQPNAGHHHILIDTELPPLDQPIPSDFNHLHLGSGQTEIEVVLPAGRHTLQLLFADHDHVPHDPPVMSRRITVEVLDEPQEKARVAAAPGARVFFVDLVDGATIPTRSIIRFGTEGVALSPAGTPRPNGGHHHLLIDTELPPLDHEIPSDFNHVHFGRGQTEAEITLPPGEHTLQLLLGDHDHVPHDPPVMSPRIRVRVVEGDQLASVRQPTARPDGKPAPTPAPPDAAVYFVYPRNGDVIFPNTTVRFGLRNMGVAPAGVAKPNTGHHHLIVNAPTPPLDEAIPADLNHIHLGGGQTERRITLPRGEHTLQLIFTDENHVPHDPPILSERIRVTVAPGGRRPEKRR
ncbi:MAG: DUF4399 domain-containing protein [Bosea sp. (in: a-proteobacteria)]|uniref:DUF4399 domain-containing protein n=1 Tax=Bosea sp. (in: a-proteobacteria) TaxID=1871050 RepID=UPI002734E23B|nr:DUF4399 domain-containing protein [Bosea sp. (in: a-proteobacteria)]MDP3257253.1 DUF4399 domain-containing protein [Bosea sp. (in: a-proteobacteria)]MDP3318378.1 DUF4399 domain-containing protein [Bosea sp. (in: a-proteobacteria)]